MIRNLIAAALILASNAAMANCVTHTIIAPNGRMVICTQCCYGGNCTTNCI
jgi:hypothetical protein